jgi:hypothetical protein
MHHLQNKQPAWLSVRKAAAVVVRSWATAAAGQQQHGL